MNARALYRGPGHVLVAANELMPEPFRSSIGQPAREICEREDCPVSAAMDRAYATGELQDVEGWVIMPVAVANETWGVALVGREPALSARQSMRDLLERSVPLVVAGMAMLAA